MEEIFNPYPIKPVKPVKLLTLFIILVSFDLTTKIHMMSELSAVSAVSHCQTLCDMTTL